MQIKIIKFTTFLVLSFVAFTANLYVIQQYQNKILDAVDLKPILTDIAANSYLITESFGTLKTSILTNNLEVKEELAGRLTILKLNINHWTQRKTQTQNKHTTLTKQANSLSDKIHSLEIAIDILTTSRNEKSNLLSKKVVLNSAIRDIAEITELTQILIDAENASIEQWNERISAHRVLAGLLLLFIGFTTLFVFYLPALRKQEKLQTAFSQVQEKSEEQAQRISVNKENIQKLTDKLAETERLLQVSNYSLARKNSSENKSKQDFNHFVLLVANRLEKPIKRMKEVLGRLDEHIKTAQPEVIKQSAETAINQNNALQHILSSILEMGKAINQTGNLSSVYLSQVVAEIATRNNSKGEVTINIQPHLPEVRAHYAPTFYILNELIKNAITFVDAKNPAISISYKLHANRHEITISDNGTPIPKEEQSKLFELFETLNKPAKKVGSGTGLAIAKYLAQRVGGNINFSIQNELNSFTFHWPAKS